MALCGQMDWKLVNAKFSWWMVFVPEQLKSFF